MLFKIAATLSRLCETDAEYVDVIHTDAGILGFPKSIGHADFYPNGGRALQPGCQQTYLLEINQTCKLTLIYLPPCLGKLVWDCTSGQKI